MFKKDSMNWFVHLRNKAGGSVNTVAEFIRYQYELLWVVIFSSQWFSDVLKLPPYVLCWFLCVQFSILVMAMTMHDTLRCHYFLVYFFVKWRNIRNM